MFNSFQFILVFINLQAIFCQNGNIEFVVDDQELFYVDQNLTWNEASSLCRSFQSSLITINEPTFILHVLEALAAFHAQELLWVGGRLVHDQWMWKISGLPINIQGENITFPSILYNRSNLHHQCLAINTKNILSPTFVNLNCTEMRGLLCEKAQQQPTLLVEEFNYNNHNYTIYEGQSSWQTAVGICNKHNMYLTALSDVTEMQEVALTLASYTHLDINMVWVGALKDFKYWQWVNTGDEVEYVIGNNTDLLKCLALDIKSQIFYAKNCSDGHAFVCESRHPNDDFWESFVHHSTEYTIHSQKTTWEKANKICQTDNSYLATVSDISAANVIAINMGNAWESLRSVWLGAKTISAKTNYILKWQETNKELSLVKNENGYPPWQKTFFDLSENTCLMLGRSVENGAYFSTSACDDARGFVCQRDSSVPLAITFDFRIGDKDLLFHDKPETWFKAQEICKLAYSRLLIISDPDDLSPVKQFTTRHKLWLDGIFEHNAWQWNHDISELPPEGTPYGLPRINKKSNSTKRCLSVYLQKTHPKFVVSSCKTKLSFICERNSQKEQNIKYKGSEYTVINKHLTWYEASAICQARDQGLAITCDINEAEFLSNLTIAYGDLWLGGIKRETKWIWDAANKTLPHRTDTKIGYPPWLYGTTNRTGTSCLTLTTDDHMHAAFIDTSCNEVKSFICERYSIQSHKHVFLEPRTAVLEDRQYMFYPQLSTWKDAYEECSDNLAFLAIVSTPHIARFIANLTYGFPEIWIGGILEQSIWKWAINGENIESWGENETQWANENEIFDEEPLAKDQFLALNRLNPNIPLFVEKNGNEKLGFVCEKANNIEEDEFLVERVPFDSGELVFFENKLNYTDAFDVCEENNGILVTADTPELMNIIERYTKKFHGLWLGATLTRRSKKFLWTHIRKEITNEIELVEGQPVVNRRVKRIAEDFRDEVLDKSEIEEELKDVYGSYEDNKSFKSEEEEEDDDNALESWEIPTKRTFPNDYDYFDIKQSNNEKRFARNFRNLDLKLKKEKATTRFSLKDSSEEGGDEDITLPDYYDKQEQSGLTTEAKAIKNNLDVSFSTDIVSTTLDVVEESMTTENVPLTKRVDTTLQVDELATATPVFYKETNAPDDTTTEKLDLDTTEVSVNESEVNFRFKYPETRAYVESTTEIDVESQTTNDVDFTSVPSATTPVTEKNTTQIIEETTEKITDDLLKNLIYCLKMNEQGKLIAMNCSLKQSFVCEIRSNKTKTSKVEEFTKDGINYVVTNEKLPWKKAFRKCNRTFGGYLAIFDSFDEMNFINNISKDFQDLWIGAKHFNYWKWPYINKILHFNSSLWTTPQRLYKCANVYRQHSSQILLIDRNCTEKQGYICKNVKSRSVDFEVIGNYTVHWRPANFFEALSICSGRNTILVSGHDREEVLNIINVHKGLHSFWTAALYVKNNWLWIYQNEKIKTSDLFTLHHISGHECLSIFKKTNASYLMVDRDCEAYLPFVCENVNNRSIVYENKSYTFYVTKQSWQEANNYCARKGQHLAIIKDEESANIVQNFALVFNDVWVGGKWENIKRWVWHFTGDIIYKDSLLHNNIHKPTEEILNVTNDVCLYAHNFMKTPGLLSSTGCFVPKGFICQGEPVDSVPLVQTIKRNNRTYTIYPRLLTWVEAQEVCIANGTYLAVMDSIEEMNIFKDFNLNTFWVGGRMEANSSWIWDHTGLEINNELLPVTKRQFQRQNRNCLSFYKFGNDLKFINLNCDLKLPFVCEEMGHNYNPQTLRLDFENEYLVLHSLQLSWNEANDMCDSAGQHLASITNENIDHFFNLPLEYHDLWLDGKNEDDIWMWTELDAEIDTSYISIASNASDSIQPFVRSSPRPNHNCLSFYRPNANEFTFLDKPCNDRFGFICQGTKYMHYQIKTTILSGREYSIYTKKASWYQANNICKSNGTYLAVLNNTQEIELLTNSNLSFVKVWTGATYRQGKWMWDHTGTEIDVNNYTKFLNNSGDCGIIKRSHQGGVAFLAKNCSLPYAFVCEERGDQGKWTTRPLNISGHYYSVSSERAIWSRAADMCAENGQYLALIDTDIEMEVINQLEIDFHDLWVGAKRSQNSNQWTWVHTGRNFLLDKTFHKLVNKSTENHCLNIYREWNSSSLFIDRDCNEQHGFICESVPISKQHPLVLHRKFSGHRYLLIQQQLTWVQAYHACDRFNGYLAVISSQAEADFLSSIDKAFHDLWIGGNKLNNSVWRWYYTNQIITNDVQWERLPTRDNHNCLNLYTADGNAGIFMDRQCMEKHSFICEETDQYEIVSEDNYPKDVDSLEEETLHGTIYPKHFLSYFVNYKGRNYMFSNVRVTFDIAVDICRKHFGYLLIFENNEEMEFIGNNSEGYHNLWIDGKRGNNTWEWEHIGTTIPSDKFICYKGRPNYDCLTFYRHDPVTSYYVERKCEEKHSFVCKDVIENAHEAPQDFIHRDRYYLLIPTSQVTWLEAKEFCEKESGYLAIADDVDEAKFLASLGNDLWVDAKFDESRNIWSWNHIHQEIIFENYNLSKYNPTVKININSRCLNIYRNLNNTPAFVERDCNDRFGFICEDLVPLPGNVTSVSREYNGRNYLFIQNKTTWENAYNICRKNKSYLAVITTKDERKFISEMTNNLRDLWVDGVYMTNSWISNYTGQNIELSTSNEDNLTSSADLTEWSSMYRRTGYNCLNAYLPFFDIFRFVGRNCSEEHSFVCEEMVEEPTPLQTIELNGVHYTISMEAVTWQEAQRKCSNHGYLAIIDTINEAAALVELSGRYHSLWIGATYNKEEWAWNYTGEVIDQEQGLWSNMVPRSELNCSILFRDDLGNPNVVGKSCNDKFGYICEEGEVSIDSKQETVFKYDGKIYTLYERPLSWDTAKKYCEKKRASLAVVENLELATLLASESVFYDFWIDGLSEGLLWLWSSTGVYLPRFERSIIKYIRIVPRTDRSCLTLFRGNNITRYLDNDCNIKKPFVCQRYDSALTFNITTVKRNKTLYYLINDAMKPWYEAWEICAANGSYLPIVKDAATADFVSSLYPYNVGEAWLGARKLNSWWSWELTDELLVEAETEVEFPIWSRLNQPDNMCLGLDHKTTMYPVFTDLNCSLSKVVICEQGCPALQPVNGSWSRKECTLRVQQISEKCGVKCHLGFLPYGYPNITCTENGWSEQIPICLSVPDFALSIISNIKNALNSYHKSNIGLLFLIDSSSSVGWENYQSMLEIIKSISVGVKAFQDNIKLGLITFEAEAKLEISLDIIETCDFIQKVDKLIYRSISDAVSFKKAFGTAQKAMRESHLSHSSVIVVFTSNNSTENIDNDLFSIKQNGNTIMVIGIKPQVNTDLIEKIASSDKPKYQINIDYSSLDEIAYVLNRTFLYSGELQCCMRLKNTNGLNINPTFCTRDVSQKNAKCSIHCNNQYHLQGMDSLLCTSDGWQSTLELKRPFPQCYTTTQVTQTLLSVLKNLYTRDIVDSTLYLIDQSGSMLEDDFYTEVKFVKHLLLMENLNVGVIVFNSEAYIEMPLDSYSSADSLCTLYDHLDSLRFSGGSTNYEKAFIAALQQIQSYRTKYNNFTHPPTLIIMLTDGQNSETIEAAETLKSQGHIIMVITVGVNKRRNLIKLVSNEMNNSPLLFSLNTFQDLENMNKYINSELYQNRTIFCCRIPVEFQKTQSRMFIIQKEDLEVNCPPGYSLSVENSTLKCSEVGLNIVPTCFAVPKRIAEYVTAQISRLFNNLVGQDRTKGQKQILVFLIDQTDTMTPAKNNQAFTFVKSMANAFLSSENRSVGLVNGQTHEAIMLIEPNVTSISEFIRLLNGIKFNSTSYSLYKPLKYILENLVETHMGNVVTVIISDRVYVSTPSLRLAQKILSSNSNLYVMEVHNETTESNIARLVENSQDFFVSGYYMLKDSIYSIDSFETLEAVAENIYLI